MNYCHGFIMTNIFKTPVDSFEGRNLPAKIEYRANKRIEKVLEMIEKQYEENLKDDDFKQINIELSNFNETANSTINTINNRINELKTMVPHQRIEQQKHKEKPYLSQKKQNYVLYG